MNEKKGNAAPVMAPTASQNGHDDFLVRQKKRLDDEKISLYDERKVLLSKANPEKDPSWQHRIQRVHEKINEIDISLLRIKHGIYFKCIACTGQIERQILEVCSTGKICCTCAQKSSQQKRC